MPFLILGTIIMLMSYTSKKMGGADSPSALPKGIRNNNPLNIRQDDNNEWLGEIGADKDGFSVFSDEIYGIRAAAKILDSYAKRGINTISGIVATWAPSHENETDAYIAFVAGNTGIGENATINRDDYPSIFYQMIKFENGAQPYTQKTIIDGVNLA